MLMDSQDELKWIIVKTLSSDNISDSDLFIYWINAIDFTLKC